MNGVMLEQVRPHDHSGVGKCEEHVVVLIERNQRRGDVAVHYSDIDDLTGIHVAIKTWGGASSVGNCIEVRGQTHGTVICKSPKSACTVDRVTYRVKGARPIRRGRITGRNNPRKHGIEDAGELGTRH